MVGFIIITLLVMFIEYSLVMVKGIEFEFWNICNDPDDMSDPDGNVIVIAVLGVLSENIYVNIYVVGTFIVKLSTATPNVKLLLTILIDNTINTK